MRAVKLSVASKRTDKIGETVSTDSKKVRIKNKQRKNLRRYNVKQKTFRCGGEWLRIQGARMDEEAKKMSKAE